MSATTLRRLAVTWAACLLIALTASATAAQAAPGDPDCDGPPGDPPPNTPAWHAREAANVFCGAQRSRDTAANPAFAAAAAQAQARRGEPVAIDPFRDPIPLAGRRFRYEPVSVPSGAGDPLDGLLFRPCDASCRDLPAGLRIHPAPYPAVIVIHGGGATQEMYMWGAEALAEAGYMVLTVQVPERDNTSGDAHYATARTALDYLMATPRDRAAGGYNPRWTELDREHVGLAGHSAGGVAVSRLGQEDPRVSAIVSWDRAQSRPLPSELRLRAPALYVVADFNCQRVPVCLPEPYPAPPDPRGPGNKDLDFQLTSAAGVDTMKIALRAATHLDFTEFAPTPPSSRYGAITTSYYTLAWFDRYLKGSDDALVRLTARTFDDSADVHYISGGAFDPRTGRNVPAQIGGQPVADRLSFHFRSAWFFDGGRLRCDDIRAGCPPASAADAAAGAERCRRPRFSPRAARVRRGRVSLRPRIFCRGRERRVVVRLNYGRRPAHTVAGRRVRLRVPSAQRRIRATFTVDGRRHRANVRLMRSGVRPRLTG